jgi:hypothetical protein
VVQTPVTAYAVTGVDPTCILTFTEAPAIGDIIEVREISTTASVTSIANSSGNAVIFVNDASANVNITGNLSVGGGTGYIYGDGSFLTNVGGGNVVATKISNGTTQANIAGSGGEFYVAVANSNTINSTTTETTFAGNVNPTGNAVQTLGNATNQWKSLYVSGNTIFIGGVALGVSGSNLSFNSNVVVTSNPTGTTTTTGNISLTGNIAAGTGFTTPGAISATGNIRGEYILGNGALLTGVITSVANINLGTSNVTVTGSGANVTVGVGGVANVAVFADAGAYITGVLSATGNISGGNLSVGTGNISGGNLSVSTGTVTVGNIVNGNANGVGNIGSSSTYFNTIFAQATSAVYADLAEKYTADAEYAPGTVVSFGGEAEVTASTADGDRRVAGVVSTNPSYIMNGALEGANVVTVALTGRVPCRVTGTVRKGDLMVSNGDGTARAEQDPRAGSIIGKALENFDGETGVIEVVIGVK